MNFKNRSAWRESILRRADNLTVYDWLRDRGSLTARLEARGQLALRLLRQGLAKPTRDEAIALGSNADQYSWILKRAL